MFSGVMLTMSLSEVFSIVIPLFYKHFINALVTGNASVHLLVVLILLAVACRAVGWALARVNGTFVALFEPRVVVEAEHLALRHLLDHSVRFFSDTFTGSLVKQVHRFSDGYKTIIENISWNILPILIDVICIVGVLFVRSLIIGAVALVWVVCFSIVNVYITRTKIELNRERARKGSETSGALADVLSNHLNVTLFHAKDRELNYVGRIHEEWRKICQKSWLYSVGGNALQNLLNLITELVVMIGAVFLWHNKQLTVGDFVLLQSYLLSLFSRLSNIGMVTRNCYEAVIDAQEMIDVLNASPDIADVPRAKALTVKKGGVEFREVSFQYHQRPILQNFSLTIAPGEKIALVGPSGAGKSTIVKLLLRLYNLTNGDILIDDQSIGQIKQDSLRDAIAFVPQEAVLFHRSLRENILYGRPDASEAQVVAAAKKAHCHDFIAALPDGYNTLVGERGIKLSGGERQRVAIARAILKNAPILVLDEATSSLDSESEALIQDALRELMQKRTSIVIAHRLSTIRQMDRIVVVEHGHVTDTGSHDELLKRTGKYQTLWGIQAGSFAAT